MVTKGGVGGAQKFISEQIVLLNHEGCSLYVSTSTNGVLVRNTKEYVSGFLIHKGIKRKTSLVYLLSLIRFIRKNKIDLVVCNSANAGLYGRLAAYLTNVKSIYVSHGWSSVYNGGYFSFILNKIEMLLSVISDKVLCISELDAQIAEHTIKVSKQKIKVIPNHIFATPSPSIRKQKLKYKVLFLGRLTHPKNPLPLIDAVNQMPQVSLYIVGEGDNYCAVKEYIKTKKIANVFLLGEISNFNDFENYDIFALFSLSEGLPISVLEAMSNGLPLLLSNIEGHLPLVNINGYLCSNDPKEINEKLLKIIENIELYSKNSLILFDENYNLQTKKNVYLDFYKELLNINQ